MILAKFCSVKIGGMTEKLDNGSGGQERVREIERSERKVKNIFILFYIILVCSMVKLN